jgi:hypothetical protein
LARDTYVRAAMRSRVAGARADLDEIQLRDEMRDRTMGR